jgi:hypothetical membrane protein
MSIAVRPAVPSAALPALARRLARRFDDIPTMHLAGLVLVVLVGGILASILTTSDPSWWQLHFSQLGTFHDLSAAFFNTALKVGGSLVVVYAVRVRRDLRRLGRRAGRRGAPTAAAFFLTVIGVNLALVGCIPLNTNKDLHDKVAGMMVLGFAALLLTSPFLLHRLPKRLPIATSLVFVFLFAGAWLFVTSTINLALFEVIAFSAMFTWSGIFTHCLTGAHARPVAATEAPTVAAARREPAVVGRSAFGTTRSTGIHSADRALVAASPFIGIPGTGISAMAAWFTGTPDTRTALAGTPIIATTLGSRPVRHARVSAVRRRPAIVRGARATLAGSAGARPSSARPRLRPASTSPRGERHGAPALPRRGCTASAGRAASGTSTTRVRRSPRRPAAAR